MDEREHTVDQWKELIYQEVIEYERTHNTLGPGGVANRVASAASANANVDGDSGEVMQHATSATAAATAAASGGRR